MDDLVKELRARVAELEAAHKRAVAEIVNAQKYAREQFDNAIAAEARVAELEAALASQWQPIETAPKDGTEIIGYGVVAGEINGPDDAPRLAAIRWSGGRTDWPGHHWDVCATDAYSAWMSATHWMPLPTPPEQNENQT